MNSATGQPAPRDSFITRQIKALQVYADRPWFPLVVGLLAGIDSVIVIIPTDGILVSSVIMAPRRWLLFAICVSVGSTLGGIWVAHLVGVNGLPWILNFYPGIDQTQTWIYTQKFFEQYGIVLTFVIALTPFMQQPAIILASLAKVPLPELAFAMVTGRLIKYVLMAYLATHAPRFLKGRWGFGAK